MRSCESTKLLGPEEIPGLAWSTLISITKLINGMKLSLMLASMEMSR